jgi:ATP-dependent helicase Lhr and Lhr-like helicase
MPLSSFHPAIQRWFTERLGEPSPPQREGWPLIRAGQHVIIAAPTGSGKTLAAFLAAIDTLLTSGASPDGPGTTAVSQATPTTTVLYVSPLRALANDVQKNLLGPISEIRALDPTLPDIRVLVRSGDTPQSERARMTRTPPHVLVTTPESLYILLTSASGRKMLATVRTVIVDEIHAMLRDKRGSHLALSLERLEALAGPYQRIGLSATQKPLSDVGHFLVGAGRKCALVDAGHLRVLDLDIETPASPLEHVCSHEQWDVIYARVATLIEAHRTTLVFVNTRKMAERLSARLAERIGEDAVTCHHGSLARARRLDAEERLKTGQLRALVATASLELGIDIGDVDLAIQVGATRSIAAFLQRMGRAGHGPSRVPKGRMFPLTIDELAEAEALLVAVERKALDRTPMPRAPLDILAQQIVAACVPESWAEADLFVAVSRAWPYRDLARDDFDAVVSLHTQGRHALLHRDGVHGRLLATKRARIPAITSGGAIPDSGDYQVLLEPEATVVGTLNEDFAIESQRGDIVQLGAHSWRILRIEPGTVRVADAEGAPPTIPFWLGEAPSRTPELSSLISEVRESGGDHEDLQAHLSSGARALGAVPTVRRIIIERFFDESGGMQLVVHAPFGGRINRAFGLALRKRFCVGFGFELQAAANEEAIVLSLGPQHSFPLDEVFGYLHSATVREVLIQALLAQPMFETRWRWNTTRALLVERARSGRRVPIRFQRMRAQDLLTAAFPDVVACGETLPPGDLTVPMEHPLVRQTVEDCLHEAMDVDGLIEVLRGLENGTIERVAIDTPEPSAFAGGILSSQPYTFLDDAPLEERRTQAVMRRRGGLDAKTLDSLGELDASAVARVRDEAWPQPGHAEEVHEVLMWIGYVTVAEGAAWRPWLEALRLEGRVVLDGDQWRAVDGPQDRKAVLRGRMEALGPVESENALLLELENDGAVLRVRLQGRQAWCDRRLLARIHRYTLDRLRKEIEPVTAADFLGFLACWQHADDAHRLEGPAGVLTVLRQLSGFEVPAALWETRVLPSRIRGYRREWLDQATLSGEFAWGRLWGSGACAVRVTPIGFYPRTELPRWLGMVDEVPTPLDGYAGQVLSALVARGAAFPQELAAATGLIPTQVEMGLAELTGRGLVTADAFAALRGLIVPPSRRLRRTPTVGRWSLLRRDPVEASPEFAARQLLRRTGVVFRKTIERERFPVPWWRLVRELRTLEARGEVRGGRFVAGFDGEQYALPEAITLLRAVRKSGYTAAAVHASDPLHYRGVLTPEPLTRTA